ncbi:hypothetical protein JCM10449v2_004178 [Rhodotorula kratochvilovae]
MLPSTASLSAPFAILVLASSAAAAPPSNAATSDSGTVVDLGKCGNWKDALDHLCPFSAGRLTSRYATVPYAAPRVGELRFKDLDHLTYDFMNDDLANSGAWMVAHGGAARGEPNPKYKGWYGASHSSNSALLPFASLSPDELTRLENQTALMNTTEAAVAHAWRAYVSSFLKHDDPSKARLPSSPAWHPATSSFRYLPWMVISQALAAGANTSAPTTSGMEVWPANEWDRQAWWHSEEVVKITRE